MSAETTTAEEAVSPPVVDLGVGVLTGPNRRSGGGRDHPPDGGDDLAAPGGHAADAGRVMNPNRCRGRVEGGFPQALGAAMFEDLRLDTLGEVESTAFREYHVPAYADVPRPARPQHPLPRPRPRT